MKGPRQVIWGTLAALLFIGLIFGSLTTALVENNTAIGLRLTPTPSPTFAGSQLTLIPGERTATLALTDTPEVHSGVCPPPQGWQAVVVQLGDSLDSLAQAYHSSAEVLFEVNCLVSHTLMPGTVIYVPAGSATETLLPTVTATVGQPATPCGRPPGWILYTVQPGDNLYRLGLAFNVSVYQLIQANCLPTTVIYAGQALYVPNVPTQTPLYSQTPTAVPTSTPTVPMTTSTETPTVPVVTTPALPTVVTMTPTPTSATPTATATPTHEPSATLTPTATPTVTPTLTPTGGPYPR